MNNQNNNPRNDLKLFTGNNVAKEKERQNQSYDRSGKKPDQKNVGTPGKKEPMDAGAVTAVNGRSNIGWLFYKDYYHGLSFQQGQSKDAFKEIFAAKNQIITSRKLSQHREEAAVLALPFDSVQGFELTTEYPGLATGLGYPHESHHEGEYKLGFHFDHTTGLPVIPGSSVKGVLRSAFQQSQEYIAYLLQEVIAVNAVGPEALEKEIFDGEGLSPYKRDVFLDAVIVVPEKEDIVFLADDFITPHPDQFKDPIPLQFLKVLPQVRFRFQFRLLDGLIPAAGKLSLFKRIILDIGLGAKTNVGYGKFRV